MTLDLGWISNEQLNEACEISQQAGVQIGRVLVMRGQITESELRATVQVQSMLRDGVIEPDTARRALQLVSWATLSIEDAFAALGIDIGLIPTTNRLGELMIAAHYLGEPDIDAALTVSLATGLPLGKSLILQGSVHASQVETGLWAQRLIREGQLDRLHAISAMQNAKFKNNKEGVKKTMTARARELQLADLLIMTGIVDENNVESALEVARVNNQPLGQMMIMFALITPELLEAANTTCELINKGKVSPSQGSFALARMYATGAKLDETLSAVISQPDISKQYNLSLCDFLKFIGSITETDVQRIVDFVLSDSNSLNKVLLQTDLIDSDSLQAATRLRFLVRRGQLSLDEAKAAYQRKRVTGTELEELIKQPIEISW